MIYSKPPFKHTRSESNPLKAYGKEVGGKIPPWELLDLEVEFQGHVSESATVKDSTIDESEGPVHIGKDAEVKSSVVRGPAWIGEGARIGPRALIRSGSIGKRCKIGQSTEVKNTLIMQKTNVPHLSYVGDSIIGSRVNLAAGTVISNLRHDEENIELRFGNEKVSTGRRKLGALIGDCVKTGANTSIYEGRVLGPFVVTGPGSMVKHNLEPFEKKVSGQIKRMTKEEVVSVFPSYKKTIQRLWDKLCAE